MTADPVIAIRGLTKTYRAGLARKPVHAVRNLALQVRSGSIVAFVGPNGAGKTTTINTLLGFLKPDSGTVRLFGAPPGPELMHRIGYQPEIFHTYSFYSAIEALRYYGRLSGMAGDALKGRIPLMLERLGLRDASKRAVKTFSKGMTQRLGLAQALLHDPELLILDEPTSGLDPEGRRLVLDIIGEEKRRGRTVFLSSHILSDVERTCDEVVMVRQGEVAFADQISAFGSATEHWEIEVTGWNADVEGALAPHTFSVSPGAEGVVRLECSAAAKKALLHTLTALPVDVGTVQPRRVATLEETYMKHLSGT